MKQNKCQTGELDQKTHKKAWGSFKKDIISTIIKFFIPQCVDSEKLRYFE